MHDIKKTYLSSTVLGSTLGGGQFTLAIVLGATIGWGRTLRLGGGLRSAEHGTRDSRVNVWLVSWTSIVGLQMLLLAWGTLGATAQMVLSS